MSCTLTELNELPSGLLDLPAEHLIARLDGPTLIHLPGRQPQPLFVTVLMHGNEPVGWEAIRQVLKRYQPGGGKLELPRALSLLIGNVRAAAQGRRHLDDQPDYNRVWPGSDAAETPEHLLMARVVEIMRDRQPFASVDLHNNTGLNPHYACVNELDPHALHLATLFSRTVIYFRRPRGVQSMAMAPICPAVTLECGKAGQRHGTEHARDFLDACLHLAEHPDHAVAAHDLDLFHTVAVVKVRPEVTFGFAGQGLDLTLAEDLDRMNFRELPAGTRFGRVGGDPLPLAVRNEQDVDVSDRYFAIEQGELFTRLPVMPSMLTRDLSVIRQDCLGYLMERLPVPE